MFKAGKMRVRKHLTCFCERSCRCVLRTPWGRWLCCRITCSASLLLNWCRNGESPPTRPTPPYPTLSVKTTSGHDAFLNCRIIDSVPWRPFLFQLLPRRFFFLKVHAELCGAAGLREQEAGGPSHSEWVSEWGSIISYDTLILLQYVELWHGQLQNVYC